MCVHTVEFKAKIFTRRGSSFYLELPEKDEDGDDLVWQQDDEVLVTMEWQDGPTRVPEGKTPKLSTR